LARVSQRMFGRRPSIWSGLMSAARIASAACLGVLLLAGCGGGSKTVTETTTGTQAQAVETTQTATTPTSTSVITTTTRQLAAQGKHGPHYFETPSHNIGCFLD